MELIRETFSRVTTYSSICKILAYAVEHNMLVHQMDQIQENICMEQFLAYTQLGKENLVCKWKKSICSPHKLLEQEVEQSYEDTRIHRE